MRPPSTAHLFCEDMVARKALARLIRDDATLEAVLDLAKLNLQSVLQRYLLGAKASPPIAPAEGGKFERVDFVDGSAAERQGGEWVASRAAMRV